MAVIREKRQFAIGPIGVARVSDSGSMVADAVVQGANQISNTLFKKAAAKAEQVGKDAALSVDREDTITLNPITNEPEAFTPPEGFGGIATEAYQRVIRARFQENIGEEIQNKGKELAARFDGMPNGVSLYQNALSEYLAAMNKASEGPFRGYIKEVGDSYLASTRASMAARQIKRERAAISNASKNAIANGNANTRRLVAINGLPESKETESYDPVRAIMGSTAAAVADGVGAGLENWNPKSLTIDNLFSVAQGALEFDLKQGASSEDLTILKAAIGSKQYNLIPETFETIRKSLGTLIGSGASFKDLNKYEKFADEVLPEAIELVKVFESREAKVLETQEKLIVSKIGFDTPGKSMAAMGSAFAGAPLSAATNAITQFQKQTELVQKTILLGRDDEAKAIKEQATAVLKGTLDALTTRSLRGLTPEAANELLLASENKNYLLAPKSSRPAFAAIQKIALKTGLNFVLEDFESNVKSYKEGGAKAVKAMVNAQAIQDALLIDTSILETSNDIDTDLGNIIEKYRAVPGLEASYTETMIDGSILRVGVNLLNRFFADGSLTKKQINEAASVLEGGPIQRNTLSKRQYQLISDARAYGIGDSIYNKKNQIPTLRKTFSAQKTVAFNRIAQEELESAENQLNNNINSGIAPQTVKVRKQFEKNVNQNLGIKGTISWGSEDSITNPVTVAALNIAKSSGYMQQSLYDNFVAAGNGMGGGSMNVMVSHWENISSRIVDGRKIPTLAAKSFRKEQPEAAAMLDYFVGASRVMGQDFAEIFSEKSNFNALSAEEKKVFINSSLENQSLDTFILSFDEITDAPTEAIDGLKALTLNLIANKVPYARIKQQVEEQIETTYPSGAGEVFSLSGAPRTPYPIDSVSQGYSDEFKEMVVRRVFEATNITDLNFGAYKIKVRDVGEENIINLDRTRIKGEGTSFYLQAISENTSTGEVFFVAKIVKPIEEGAHEMVNTTFGDYYEGETVTVRGPLIISSHDPEFIEEITLLKNILKEEELDAAREESAKAKPYDDNTAIVPLPTVKDFTKGSLIEGFNPIDTIKNFPFFKGALKGTVFEGDSE